MHLTNNTTKGSKLFSWVHSQGSKFSSFVCNMTIKYKNPCNFYDAFNKEYHKRFKTFISGSFPMLKILLIWASFPQDRVKK